MSKHGYYGYYSNGRSASAVYSDEALLQRITQHDETALRDLYQRYRPMVARIAQHIVHDESTTDEVIQDVFQLVWSGAEQPKPGTCVSTWLCKMARFRAMNTWHSKLQRQRQREACLDDPVVLRQLAATEMGEETLLLRESVRSALAMLAPTLRITLEMYVYRQLSPTEIALRSGVSISMVRRRLGYGLYKLRTQLIDAEAPALTDPRVLAYCGTRWMPDVL